MIPHIQTNTGENTGSCMATCIASILDLPLEDVPNFRVEAGETGCMVSLADQWLRANHGKRLISIELYTEEGRAKIDQVLLNRLCTPDELVILSGASPRPNADGSRKFHAVVAKPKMWGFELVHDPHPDGTGIVGQPYGVKWIVPVS